MIQSTDAFQRLNGLATLAEHVARQQLVKLYGRISAIGGNSISIEGLAHAVTTGEFVYLIGRNETVLSQVTGIRGRGITVTPAGTSSGLTLGDRATPAGPLIVHPDRSWKGRICNAMCHPIDGGPELAQGAESVALDNAPPLAMQRESVGDRIVTGVKAIDVFTPICSGQRIGIFAGSGVGKSTLLAMLSKSPDFDCVVVALVGERGREVREFALDVLGEDRKKAILVVATSDEPAVMRKLGATVATSLAEYFRDLGERVLLIMDSVTRYAQACREIALAAGEPPVARGFPPSVFSDLPFLLERAGPGPLGSGSITGIYTVLVDGDDHNEPVADTVRGTLDGHIVLDRTIAAGGRYPAIDLLQSISRLSSKAWTQDEATSVTSWKRLLMRYEESKDLRALGGYQRGADAELDIAIELAPRLYKAIEQSLQHRPTTAAFAEVAQAVEPIQGSDATSAKA